MLATADLLADLKRRETIKSLARRYGVHPVTIWRWLKKLECNKTLHIRKRRAITIAIQCDYMGQPTSGVDSIEDKKSESAS